MKPKRHYRRQDELRALLVSEGVQLLLEADAADSEVVTFSRVFERIERAGHPRVTKGSILGPDRTWPSQRQFRADVEAATARALSEVHIELHETLAAAATILDGADTSTKAGRADAVRQLCRVAGERSFVELVGSKPWQWFGLWVKAASTHDLDDQAGIRVALKGAQAAISRGLAEQVYAPLVELLGYQARAEYGSTDQALRLLVVAVIALGDGLVIRERLSPDDLVPIHRPTGPGGRLQPWHPFSIALEALVNQYLEPAPRRTTRTTR